MVTWIVGRSGSGKTTELLSRLEMLASRYSAVYLLVPEQSSMALERKIGQMGLEGVEVVSFRRLCNVIFRRFGGVAGTYMTKTREIALIYRILQEKRSQLHYYRNARLSMGFVERLADSFSELSMAGLSEEAVLTLLEAQNRPDWQLKYQDLFLLYRAYQQSLTEDQRSAGEDLQVAAEMAREKGFFCDKAVVMDGFFGFTGVQQELLRILFSQSPTVIGSFLLDPQDPALCFDPARGELKQLQKLAEEAGTSFEVQIMEGGAKRGLPKDLLWLERWLMAEQKPSGEVPDPEHLRILEGRNIREELAMVAVDIAAKVRTRGMRYRDFALIAGSLDTYGPVAESVFEKYGVPLFVDRGRPSMSKPLFAFVQSALRMICPERYFCREDVLSFLKTGLCGEDQDLIARVENYSEIWKISGERWIREQDWTQNPRGLDRMRPEDEEQLAELNGLRRRLRKPLLAFREKCALGTGAALAEGIYQLMQEFRVEEQIVARAEKALIQAREKPAQAVAYRRISREYQQLYSALTDILDDIYQVFGETPLSCYAMEELIGLCGEEADLNVTPPTIDAVTLGEVAHSRLEDIRGLYVVGANQGLLPMPVSETGLIAERERRLFEAHQLPCNATQQRQLLQGRHRLYAALFTAREELTFSYSAFEADGSPKLASPYVGRLKELMGVSVSRRCNFDLYDFATTRDGARELMSWEPRFRQPILRELQETMPPPSEQKDRLPEEVVRRIFGDRLRLSYSQISLFQQCPFRYFMEKTMRIQPLRPVTFDAANIGTFVHAGMEALTQQLIQKKYQYDSYTPDKIQQFGESFAQQYLQNQLGDLEDTPRFRALFNRMTELLCRVAGNVLDELREGRYRPVAAEYKLDRTVLPLSAGRSVQLIGSVDRVDAYETSEATYLKVTDYKTGKEEFNERGVTNRTGVQLPIYLYGLMKSGDFKNPRPAAGCYMKAQQPFFDSPVSSEELPEKLRDFYRRQGAFSRDPIALQGLDSAGGSRYFKLNYTKAGVPDARATAYEPEVMEQMVGHMERVIRDTAEGIFGGEVAPVPLREEQHDPCRFCHFGGLCHHNSETDPERVWNRDPEGWRKEEGTDA